MRFDKLTAKFQQALAEAQSLALAADSSYLEAGFVLKALLDDQNSGAAALLAHAGVNVPPGEAAFATAFKQPAESVRSGRRYSAQPRIAGSVEPDGQSRNQTRRCLYRQRTFPACLGAAERCEPAKS